MKQLYDQVSIQCSKLTTKTYSTSFSFGIRFLNSRMRNPIYSIYGFVRFADEIVDSFEGYDKNYLLAKFKADTADAIDKRISLNPILNAFQQVVHQFNIGHHLIDTFLKSMEMDLDKTHYNEERYQQYILGSAEVVGLMCLRVFTEGDTILFNQLKPYAMKLGAAFQKINFLRDVKADNEILGRTYFPSVDLNNFSVNDKIKIEKEIANDFEIALIGIRQLPVSSRKGVYLAYYYYTVLFKKIKRLPPHQILKGRIRIPNFQKTVLIFKSSLRHQLNIL